MSQVNSIKKVSYRRKPVSRDVADNAASVDWTPAFAGVTEREMLHALPDALLAVGADDIIVFSSHGAQAFLGRGETALTGHSLSAVLGDVSPVHDALASARTAGQSLTVHDLVIGGKPVSAMSVLPLADGIYLLVLRCDIPVIKSEWMARVKAALKPAQHIARVLAHEIKNPLAGIRGAAQLLVKSDLTEDDKTLAGLIDREAQRILRLLDKVNVFDDAPRHQYKPVNIHTVLDHAVQAAKIGFGSDVDIQVIYDPSLPEIDGHHDRLVQAFLNLLKNAAEAGAGTIIIRSYYATSADFHPESHAKLPICVDIEDNGSGIDAETQAHLFEPYYTTKPAGEGLGLSIVSKIIDDHVGAIDVSSHPGKTVFKISLPRGVQS